MTLRAGEIYNPFMHLKGTITCQQCGKKRDILAEKCSCGYSKVFFRIDYKGQRYRFFYDKEGEPYTVTTAMSTQVEINGTWKWVSNGLQDNPDYTIDGEIYYWDVSIYEGYLRMQGRLE